MTELWVYATFPKANASSLEILESPSLFTCTERELSFFKAAVFHYKANADARIFYS